MFLNSVINAVFIRFYYSQKNTPDKYIHTSVHQQESQTTTQNLSSWTILCTENTRNIKKTMVYYVLFRSNQVYINRKNAYGAYSIIT